jgi:hypothetical protein
MFGPPSFEQGGNFAFLHRFAIQTRTFVAGIFGAPVAGVTVLIDSTGQLGVLSSSQRFKDEIKPMDTASEVILASGQ